ncbi:LacI family DNA-binding transcriptional regulator [Anaerococcus sp. NML200574]|uniref:LacI family DNA-binding transcriptional regulator n=1 Tax=unclassified Anaerococcus TaxID=2614126 RepID=UPI000D0B9109|nr:MULTISPECIES: LacI family DNA-binding transcriptional regulator [unclassified Anaerococcus]MCW6678281.1 LacI family DNA-binding transcriptional regulator [Anaerococcus sp. NML200574]
MATMKDVANEAKVSLGSVSNVINGREVKPETYRRVMDAIEKLNYEKNDLASGLKNNKTNTIGLIIPTIWHPFFSEMTFHVEQLLQKRGYKLLLCNSNGCEDSEIQYLQMLRKNMIDGIIAISYSDIEVYINSNLPFVSIDRKFDKNINFVASQNYEGGLLAAKTLDSKGCKELLYVGSHNKFMNATMDRRRGFEDFCKDNKISYHIIDMLEPYEGLDDQIYAIFKENPDIDGIFTINDFVGMDVIEILKAIGKEVLDDYQMIGFDGIKLSEERSYMVSTIVQDVEKIATRSVDILLKNIEDENYYANSYVEVRFEEGGTTK